MRHQNRFRRWPRVWLYAVLACAATQICAAEPERLSLAVFTADVTPPIGHPLQGGIGIADAARIDDPLLAHGVVLLGSGDPILLAAVDWCGIGNDAHDRWREALAQAVGTSAARVLVASLHQHDAPLADLAAERLVAAQGLERSTLDVSFHEKAVARVAAAAAAALERREPLTHIGIGQAEVKQVASNRRILGEDGKVRLVRGSASKDPLAKAAPEGTIDPWLKTLSFWNGDKPLAALSVYATHPMSHYGKGGVSSDFVGLAVKRRQAASPGVLHFYATGCGGNIGAGKYNDGTPAMREVLAGRLLAAMDEAWRKTVKHPLREVGFRATPLVLPPREDAGFSRRELEALLANPAAAFDERARAAYALSWRARADAGRKLDLPALDFGCASLLLLPGEPFVEYQLAAQKLCPERFVMVLGYGDYGPVYIPTARAYEEGGYEPGEWSFVSPAAERALLDGMERALSR